MGFVVTALELWASHGAVTFATGLLPLFITSQPLFNSLYKFGIGRLIASTRLALLISSLFLGTASTLSYTGKGGFPFSPAVVALSHIAGLLVMLVVERRLSSRTLDGNVPDDMELRELETTGDVPPQSPSASRTTRALGPHQRRIYLFTFAFVVPEVVSGLYLGYAATVLPWKDGLGELSIPSFHTVIMHSLELLGKAPIVLALATTLLAASLPIAQCKRHILVFAAAAPSTALLSFLRRDEALSYWSYRSNLAPKLPPSPPAILYHGMFVYAAIVVRVLISNSRTTARGGIFKTLLLVAAGALSGPVVEMVRMAVSIPSSEPEA